jgi:hypothetical protein
MRQTLQEIDFLTTQLRGLMEPVNSLSARRVEAIQAFRRQVVTTMYQGEASFNAAFTEEESVNYLCGLFAIGVLDPLPDNLPTTVSSSLRKFFVSFMNSFLSLSSIP